MENMFPKEKLRQQRINFPVFGNIFWMLNKCEKLYFFYKNTINIMYVSAVFIYNICVNAIFYIKKECIIDMVVETQINTSKSRRQKF